MAQINIKKNDSTSISTPPVGIQALFVANDGGLYTMNSFGTVSTIGGGGSGSSGSSGSSGTSGVNGVSGSSGTSGANGVSGSSGTSGSGSSGTSGLSGTSGTSPAGGDSPIVILNTNQLVSLSLGATAAGAVADASIAIGLNANAKNLYLDNPDRSPIAIGRNSLSSGNSTISLGHNANCAQGNYGVAIGFNAGGGGGVEDSAVAIGGNSLSNSGGSVAIGYEARASGSYAVSIGGSNPINYGHCSVTIGGQAGMYDFDFCEESVTIGWRSRMKASYGVSLGGYAKVTAANATAVGYGTTASHTGSVALGNGMTSSVANHTHINSLFIASAPVYADNAAALTGGLIAGQVYRTSTGVLMITY